MKTETEKMLEKYRGAYVIELDGVTWRKLKTGDILEDGDMYVNKDYVGVTRCERSTVNSAETYYRADKSIAEVKPETLLECIARCANLGIINFQDETYTLLLEGDIIKTGDIYIGFMTGIARPTGRAGQVVKPDWRYYRVNKYIAEENLLKTMYKYRELYSVLTAEGMYRRLSVGGTVSHGDIVINTDMGIAYRSTFPGKLLGDGDMPYFKKIADKVKSTSDREKCYCKCWNGLPVPDTIWDRWNTNTPKADKVKTFSMRMTEEYLALSFDGIPITGFASGGHVSKPAKNTSKDIEDFIYKVPEATLDDLLEARKNLEARIKEERRPKPLPVSISKHYMWLEGKVFYRLEKHSTIAKDDVFINGDGSCVYVKNLIGHKAGNYDIYRKTQTGVVWMGSKSYAISDLFLHQGTTYRRLVEGDTVKHGDIGKNAYGDYIKYSSAIGTPYLGRCYAGRPLENDKKKPHVPSDVNISQNEDLWPGAAAYIKYCKETYE